MSEWRVMFLQKQNNSIIKNKLFFWSFFLITVFIFSIYASAEIIVVVPGNSGEDNPPADNSPTVDYIECPEGYSCIKAEDYSQFISSLSSFTEEINERTLFIEAVFDRFDKKIVNDKELYASLSEITSRAQDQADRFESSFKEAVQQKENNKVVYERRLKTLEIQVAELKAVSFWQFLIVVMLAIFLHEFIVRLKKQAKFVWAWIQEIIPVKMS